MNLNTVGMNFHNNPVAIHSYCEVYSKHDTNWDTEGG